MSGHADHHQGQQADCRPARMAHSSRTPAVKREAGRAAAPARAVFAAAVALLLSSALADAETGSIVFRPEAELPGPAISLRDVAEVSGSNADKLGALTLGLVPWPGAKTLVDATVVKIHLYREGIDLRSVTISGAGCVVSTRTATVPAEQLLEVARQALADRLPCADDVQIEPVTRPEAVLVAAGSSPPTLRASMAGSGPAAGRAPVCVTGSVDGTEVFRTTIVFQVHAFETVMVARRDILQGEPLSEDCIIDKRLDVTTLSPGNHFSTASALAGAKAARLIRAGMPVTRQMIVFPPAVRKGDLVQIVFRTPFITLSARGVAREDGSPGQAIRVNNIDSGRDVTGEVTRAGQVSVGF